MQVTSDTVDRIFGGPEPMLQPLKGEVQNFFRPFAVGRVQMGSMVSGTTMAVDWDSIERSSSYFHNLHPVKFNISFTHSHFVIFFFAGRTLYKAQIAFEFVRGRVVVMDSPMETLLLIQTTHNPLVWSSTTDHLPGTIRNPWAPLQLGSPRFAPLSNPNRHRLENWPVWKLHLRRGDGNGHLQTALEILVKYRLAVLTYERNLFSTISTKELLTPAEVPASITFNRLYLIECLVTNNLLSYRLLTKEFFDLILQAPRQALVQAVEYAWNVREYIPDPLGFFKLQLQRQIQTAAQVYNPSTHALVRKVVVTPSKVYLLPPIMEESNRVLRTYLKAQDRFLRVNFVDEGFNSIHPNTTMNLKLLKRVADVMELGMTVARRKYEFLAFSSSQLKEHGCWFFSRGKGADGLTYSAEKIRAELGDFSEIHFVAKHAARIGQCFSSSRDGAKLVEGSFATIPDITCGDNCLTDGVGKISLSLMKAITKQLRLAQLPSAIQFRMGGYKGVLAVWPNLDHDVQLRPSQRKFDSRHTTLEVLRIACYNSAHLNRQIITLLTTLGVPDVTFLTLQDEMLAEISLMRTDPVAALRALARFSDEFGTARVLTTLLEGGLFSSEDCFARNCLEALYVYQHNELKNRARIQVPKGALLIGVADETNILHEDQIFVRLSNPLRPGSTTIVTGECMVTRNPCFHPGDIRVVTAVDVPALRHLKDCVVFSTRGQRSLASMCSGGDLDGDEFTVIWDPRLLPPERNLEPLRELPAQPNYVERVSVEDIKRFFGDYISNDNLGQIANAHLARCDASPLGARDPICLYLAQLHSRAVDFTKSGIPATLPPDCRAEKFPDFMNKADKLSYRSTKILGRLYRTLDYVNVNRLTQIAPDPSLRVEGFEVDLEEAYIVKRDYDATLLSLMNQYGIKNELEVVTGCIVNHRQMVSKRLFEVRRLVAAAYQAIVAHFRAKFLEEFEFAEDDDLPQKVRRKAYAWYHAAYTPTVVECGPQLESFGWIAVDYLIPIKRASEFKALNDPTLTSSYTFPPNRCSPPSTKTHAEEDAENMAKLEEVVKYLSLA
ncbi:hypothetical protein L0F63_000733 [Massospora cicadina]|nr:hypothetical protein L0F63_000733 [Massospora cicadina]